MPMYNATVMDHFNNPRNVGEIEKPDGVGVAGDPVCGDYLRLYIKVEDDRLVDIKFKIFGCGAAIASSSMLTVMATGCTIDEALQIGDDDVDQAIGGLPEAKKHCSILAADALHHAIIDYLKRRMAEVDAAEEGEGALSFKDRPSGS